jgi:high affinity Mn2+ porin
MASFNLASNRRNGVQPGDEIVRRISFLISLVAARRQSAAMTRETAVMFSSGKLVRWSRRRSSKCAFPGLGLGMLAIANSANAADLPLKAPALQTVYNWTGFYIGGHVGYGGGSLGPGTNPVPGEGVFLPPSVTGFIGGYQAGYNRQFSDHVVLGIEADATFESPVDAPRQAPAAFNATNDYYSTVRGRVGYAFDRWLPYLTGGFAWGHSHLNLNDSAGSIFATPGQIQIGWTAGAGVEFAVSGNWSARLEYDYIDLGRRTYDLTGYGLPNVSVEPNVNLVKLGLNYRFDDIALGTDQAAANGKTALPESDVWNVHAQTTFLPSVYPAFRSPYAGANSLPGGGLAQETWTTTAFLGVRLWQGGEFYFNPEMAQGFGIGGTLGLAGFPNGEAQKAGAAEPKIRPQRYYLKQTFGLGGEQEDVPDAANQLAGKRDIDRITLIVGRFAVGDFFDNNSYAHDPRADFMNWAMWSSAAYDFPADLPGYTRGAVVELNRKDWAVRAGVFEVPNAPNSDVLVLNGNNYGTVAELEERYSPFDQPGKLRLGIFTNRGDTGNYNQALSIEDADPALDINTVMASIRQPNLKYGFYVNAEQQIVKDVGLFARASWNDGQNEILSFTDIDRSVSGGLSIKGSFWGRASDTIGIGGAVNGLSQAHRDFLAAGGLGLLIGDGQLNYRPEQILETYYAYAVREGFTVTADYQLITNPAYNADRGPVSVFSARLHGEF